MAWGVFLKRTTRRDRGRQPSGDSLEQSKADAVEQQHQVPVLLHTPNNTKFQSQILPTPVHSGTVTVHKLKILTDYADQRQLIMKMICVQFLL